MKILASIRRKVKTAMMAFLKGFICLSAYLTASIIRVATSLCGRVQATAKDVQNKTYRLFHSFVMTRLYYIPSFYNFKPKTTLSYGI